MGNLSNTEAGTGSKTAATHPFYLDGFTLPGFRIERCPLSPTEKVSKICREPVLAASHGLFQATVALQKNFDRDYRVWDTRHLGEPHSGKLKTIKSSKTFLRQESARLMHNDLQSPYVLRC